MNKNKVNVSLRHWLRTLCLSMFFIASANAQAGLLSHASVLADSDKITNSATNVIFSSSTMSVFGFFDTYESTTIPPLFVPPPIATNGLIDLPYNASAPSGSFVTTDGPGNLLLSGILADTRWSDGVVELLFALNSGSNRASFGSDFAVMELAFGFTLPQNFLLNPPPFSPVPLIYAANMTIYGVAIDNSQPIPEPSSLALLLISGLAWRFAANNRLRA
ncbi:PEP-CTERM sorting domain-containing protein [Neiella marina]|uniref:PEP-CTERM sorting domain-containing protein n=1 Tax=Neiella holothuriorum TaxID=2870530 RepID=A0ABS7EG15_9GAMM|nr:PEP-CTERM sorting domain-containing protein [Neiella holothuriorum]MBW8190642.1 PEP-CTERM sorting domain-containing protein [Neiella holothuriorum]